MMHLYRRCLIALIVLILAGKDSPAQFSPTIQWQKTFGGTHIEEASAISEAADGGYVIAGYTASIDGDVIGPKTYTADVWIIKINTSGVLQWQKKFGGSREDVATSIKTTKDGGYIAAGYTYSKDSLFVNADGGTKVWVAKLTPLGDIEWIKTYGGSGSEKAVEVIESNDGGYMVACSSNSNDGDVSGNHKSGYYIYNDVWIVKLNKSGDIQWQQTIGGKDQDFASCIKQTPDNGFIILGSATSNDGDVSGNHGGSDYWLAKLDSSGSLLWQKAFGGTRGETATSMVLAADGGYVLSGSSNSRDGDVYANYGTDFYSFDIWILKVNKDGVIEWQKNLGGSDYEEAYGLARTNDGGYIISGYTASFDSDITFNNGGVTDFWLIKVNDSGAIQWQKTLGGSERDIASCVMQDKDGNFIVAGFTESNDGGVTNFHGTEDLWVVKLSEKSSESVKNGIQENKKNISFFSVPFVTSSSVNIYFEISASAFVCLSLIDVWGNTVSTALNENLNSGHFQFSIPTNNLPSGIYFLRLKAGGDQEIKKLVFTK